MMLGLFMGLVDAEPLGNSCSPYGASTFRLLLICFVFVGFFFLFSPPPLLSLSSGRLLFLLTFFFFFLTVIFMDLLSVNSNSFFLC